MKTKYSQNLSQIIKPKPKFHFYRFMNSKTKPQICNETFPNSLELHKGEKNREISLPMVTQVLNVIWLSPSSP